MKMRAGIVALGATAMLLLAGCGDGHGNSTTGLVFTAAGSTLPAVPGCTPKKPLYSMEGGASDNSVWSGTYIGAGAVDFGSSKQAAFPSWEASFIPGPNMLQFVGQPNNDQGAEGISLNLSNVQGRAVESVALTAPYPKGGSDTYSFDLREALPWIASPIGSKTSTEDDKCDYTISLAHTAASQWLFTITPRFPSRLRSGLLSSTTILMSANRPRPPWSKVQLALAGVVNPTERFDAAVSLTRTRSDF